MDAGTAKDAKVAAKATKEAEKLTKETERDVSFKKMMNEVAQETNMEQPQPQQPQQQSLRAVYRSTESLSVNEIELSSVLQTFKRVSNHKRNSTMFSVSERSETTEPPETKDTNDATNDATNDDGDYQADDNATCTH